MVSEEYLAGYVQGVADMKEILKEALEKTTNELGVKVDLSLLDNQ